MPDNSSSPDTDNKAAVPPRRRAGLGRGLEALLGEVRVEAPVRAPEAAGQGEAGGTAPAASGGESATNGAVRHLPIADLRPHPGQPRRHFAEEALNELAASIAQRGIIQPIVVRPMGRGYQIIAGERRWRAAQRARLHEVPAIVRDFSDGEALEIALIENIQREDLNPIEEAEAYRKLIDEFGHSQQELARLVDKSRSHVANLMRLLDLPDGVRARVVDGRISMGHARALIHVEGAEAIAARIEAEGLSVRQVEALARKAKGGADTPRTRGKANEVSGDARAFDADLKALEQQLADMIGLRVMIEPKPAQPDSGTLRVEYSTLDQLDMLCQRLSGERF